MKAVILAGGEATRLRPLTCNTPKMMVPVLNRPFFEHLASYLRKHNVVDIILAVGKSSEQIQDHFGDGSKLGVRLTYSTEAVPLGTAGAVKNTEGLLHDSFAVLNGDIFTDIDLSRMMRLHEGDRAVASLALTPVEDPTIYGVVETDGESRVKCFMEKPARDKVTTNMINAGIYILEPSVLNCVAPNTFSMFERDVFPALLERGQVVCGYPLQEYWIDIGTPDKYLTLHHDLLGRQKVHDGVGSQCQSFVHSSARIEGPAIIGEDCCIDRNTIIRGPVVLGARCRVQEGAVVEGAVLWQDCQIGEGARLRNCLLACRCRIGEDSEIQDDCVLGDDVSVEKGSKLSRGIKVWPGETIRPGSVLP